MAKEYFTDDKYEDMNPTNTDEVLAVFQKGDEKDAARAIEAAQKAFPMWEKTPWQERVRLMRRVADLIDERIYEIGAIVALEVGKNRMEALGDVAEMADLIRYACTQMEVNDGFIKQLGSDPLSGYSATNYSVLRPYGVWLVISPFNFPAALTGGPCGAALVSGNTLVFKPATDTTWTSRKLAECMRDAGLPDGVFNFVSGPGRSMGQALIENPAVAGITFTGSYDVGMGIYRDFAKGEYVRPTILELGGKNPAIVSRNADIEEAAAGIVRSAFGLQDKNALPVRGFMLKNRCTRH
jgi:1-pyrroline-5-carboxylate dehydrogenase